MPVYVGVDFHARTQTVCWCDPGTGEVGERTLDHQRDDIAAFYAQFPGPAVVGLETSGYAQWFHQLVEERGHELRVGDAHAIRQLARRRQKNDRRDAALLLDLLLRGDFPVVHRPSAASREVLDLLHHRRRLVRMSTMMKNSLHALAMNYRMQRGAHLFSARGRAAFEQLRVGPAEAWHRRDSFDLLATVRERIAALDAALEARAQADPRVQRLRTHPGVGRLTALAFVHTVEPVARFALSAQLAAYCGLDPQEHSSGDRVRMGSISKQGNRLLRHLLVEAAHVAVRPAQDEELRRFHHHLLARKKNSAIAIIAVARKLALRLFVLLRDQIDYQEFRRRGRDAECARDNA